MKKLLTLFLLLVASIGTMFAWDYEHVQIGDLYYNLDAMDKTAEVTKEAYSGLTTANIPASVTYSGTTYSVTSIGEWTFMGCSSLTSVTIPNSVTSIESRAFNGCSGLTSVTIPNSVTSIGGDAFAGCSSLPVIDNLRYADTYLVEAVDKTLSSYSIKEGTKWIGDYAFSGCSGLTSIEIPNSVTSIGGYAFRECSSLTYPVYNAHVFAFMPTSYTGAYTIPEGIESIAGCAFYGCSNLTSVTIPNSVKTLGYSAFANCSVLNHVEFPNSIEYCEQYVFRGCPDISTPICNSHVFAYLPVSYTGAYTIPDGIKIVAGGSCAYCDKLTSVTIPNSVKSINAQAFYQCSNLEYVSLGDNLEKIEFGAFYGCYKLLDVHFPNSLKLITGSRMGQGGAFEYCSGLTSVTIPNSVTSIGSWAFSDCSGLTSVTNYATTPQATVNSTTFNGVNKSACKLYVPAQSVSLYRAAEVWQDFQVCPIITANQDPDNASAYYTTFFDNTAKYELPAGVEAYIANVVKGDELMLSKVAEGGDVLPIGEPVILKSTAASYSMEVSTADPVSVGTNILSGTDDATTAPSNTYVLSGHSSDNTIQGLGFYRFSGTLAAHKAYVVLGGVSGAPRRLRFSFNETNQTTGVEQVPSNQVQSTKVIENGVLYIIKNGVKYNVQGERAE